MDKFNKLLAKKHREGKTLNPMQMEAKGSVLGDLVDDMIDMGGDKVKGIKKITVAGSDPRAIERGLDKAKEIVSAAPEGLEEDVEEAPVQEEMTEELVEELTKEEIEMKIEELKKQLEGMNSSSY